MKIKAFLLKNIYQVMVIGFCILLGVINYVPHEYLTGWDNLQTELSPLLAIKRALFSGWQEYQSFGLISGMAHATDLVRTLFQGFVGLFIPNHMVRYVSQMMLIAVGAIGCFRLISSVIKNKITSSRIGLFSCLGSIFYVLNYGTVQIMSLPYEPFTWFFASLPWLLYFFNTLLQKSVSKNAIIIFVIANLLSTPSFYLQTQFVVYGFCLISLAIGNMIISKSKKAILKKSILLGLLILVINSFWILPQTYFIKSGGVKVVSDAKSNSLATQETFYQNLEKGTLTNFLTFEGHYNDLFSSGNKHIFKSWKDYHISFVGQISRYLIALIVVIGVGTSIKNKKNTPILIVYVLVALTLLSNTFPIDVINELLRKIPFLHQIFRSPFTKFVIPYSLVASILFASGLIIINDKMSKYIRKSHIYIGVLATVLLFIYAFPAFRGNYFAPSMKVEIPTPYFQLFDYFKTQPKNARIAILPEYTIWGWFRTNWGYDGSGFLWYGIEQPIVSRTFDVWSKTSEGYYWELKNAINKMDSAMFKNVLNKYRVDYLVVDDSLMAVGTSYKTIRYDDMYELIAQTSGITLDSKFKNLKVYKVTHPLSSNNFVSLLSGVSNQGPAIEITNHDATYADKADYFTDLIADFDTYYPYNDLFTQTKNKSKKWGIYESSDSIFVQSNIDANIDNKKLLVDSTSYQHESYYDFDSSVNYLPLSFNKENSALIAQIPKVNVATILLTEGATSSCGITKGKVDIKKNETEVILRSDAGATACLGFDLPYLNQKYGYLLKIDNQNIKGRNLFFYVLDKTRHQPVIEDLLTENKAYYIIPTGRSYSLGYSIVFQNNSNVGLPSINRIDNIELFAFPVDTLQSSRFISDIPGDAKATSNDSVKVNKVSYYQYLVEMDNTDTDQNQILSLWQSYDGGWQAFEIESDSDLAVHLPWFFGKKLENHVLVNNWANGWSFDSAQDKACAKNSCKIVIVFWPQYLQFLGFGIVITTFVALILVKKKDNLVK